MKTEFIQPRFDGRRFEDHTLPVEVARDLAAYETLVIELAKHLYLQEHHDRQRIPKGFTADFHLHLEKIDPGSARPLLSVVAAGAPGSAGGTHTYFERARDLIGECIASPDGQLPVDFPRELLVHFNQIGRSLRSDESLELPRAGAAPAVLTPERRKRLVLAADKVYEREIELLGSIGEADWEKSSVRLRLANGSQTVVAMPESFHAKAREFGGRPRHQVTLKGVATFDSWDVLQKVVAVESLEIQRNYELVKRLDELAEFKHGWLDGDGVALDSDRLALVSEKFEAHFPESVSLPAIVPTPAGNILLEWTAPGHPSVDLLLAQLGAEFHSFGADGIEIEKEFRLADDIAWEQFFAFLSEQIKEPLV